MMIFARQDLGINEETMTVQLKWLKVVVVLKEAVTSGEVNEVAANPASLERVFCLSSQMRAYERDPSQQFSAWLKLVAEHVKPLTDLIMSIKKAKLACMAVALKEKMEALQPLCKGGFDHKDWKAGLAKDASWEAIVTKGQYLLDVSLAKAINSAMRALQEDSLGQAA